MGCGSFQPDFKSFATLQTEPAKGSLDPNPSVEPEKAESSDGVATEGTKPLTISMYQDPGTSSTLSAIRSVGSAVGRLATRPTNSTAPAPCRA
jgi:hypothetical protein